MPDDQQGQQYDTSQLDSVEHPTLGTLKFPKAMPPEERNASIDRMLQSKPAQSTATQTETPPAKKSFWQRGWEGLTQKLPRPAGGGEEAELASSASEGLSGLGSIAKESAQKSQQEDLSKVAKTGEQPSFGRKALQYAKNVAGSTADAAAGMTSPAGQAIGAGMLAAPEVVGPILGVHGLGKAMFHAKGALAGNPEEAEQSLGGAAEAAGGAAAGVAGLEGGVAESNLAKVPKNAIRYARESMGRQLTPEEATTARPAAAFQPALANTPKEVLDHATQEGINLTPFQASESRVAGKLQVAGEHGIVGGEPLEKAMNGERAKFGEAVNKLSERVDPTRLGLSEEGSGEAIKQATETAKSVAHDNASQGYKKIDYLMKESVEPKGISDKWNEVRESLPMGAEEQILAQAPRNMHAVVEDLLSGKPEGFKPTFEQGIQLRKFFRELSDTEGLPSRTEALYKTMEKTVGKAMDSTAKGLGSLKEWGDANQGWRDYTGKYGDKQSPLYKILKQSDPARITRDLMNRASAADVEILRNEGMTSALEPLRRQVIQDIARNKFTVGRDGLGGYSDSFIRQLFGPAAQKELYLKADLARRMNWEPNPSGSGGQLLVGEQLSKPSKIAQLFGAAKLSMPKPAQSYLPQGNPTPFKINPKLLRPALIAASQQSRGQ